MTLDLTKPLTTRDGRPVRLLAQDVASDYPIVGVIKNSDRSEDVRVWNARGGIIAGHETATDLINPPEKIEGWLNVYPRASNGSCTMVLHPTREVADELATTERVACFEVAINHGAGL